MEAMTTFDSTKESLLDLLQSIRQMKTQLPDFQRGWVWDDEHIRSLLASVSLSYPIGTVMLLQTGNDDVRFKPRLVEGVRSDHPPTPDRLILDGQQRLTSLFLSLYAGQPVATRNPRGHPIRRWYYLDIAKALNPYEDREDAIIGLPEDRKIRNFRGEVIADHSTTAHECAAQLLPLPLIFDTPGLTTWQMHYLNAEPTQLQERLARWNALMQAVIQRIQQYQVPLILLRKETPKEAVCQVFEKVNTGGVSLTVFELLTATYAADDFNLREDWMARAKRLRQQRVLGTVENDDFLQTVTLLTTYAKRAQSLTEGMALEHAPGISCKRKEILRLSLNDYQHWADAATEGFEKAGKFLYGQQFFAARDLPYRTQLIPLAAIFALLQERADTDGVRSKIAQWYWCGVFGELYGSATETRFARDLPDVLTWIDGGAEPSTIADANFAPARLFTLRTRNSAAYKGLYALLLRDGGWDFRTGEPVDVQRYFDESIDIHHIFPQDWCKKEGIDPRRYDCIVNKTPLAAKTNRILGGNPPSVYLARLQKSAEIDETRMAHILRSHVIDPESLRTDKFEAFFQAREEALLTRIEQVMRKPIAREITTPMVDDVLADDHEDEEHEP
jgi:hypothetical protein